MKFNLLIIGVIVLQGGFLLAFLISRFNQINRYNELPTISWTVVFLLTILLPFVLSLFFILKRATKKRIVLLLISVLVVESVFAVISPFLYGGTGNPDLALFDWLIVGFIYGLPIAGLSLLSTIILSFKSYKRSQQGNRL